MDSMENVSTVTGPFGTLRKETEVIAFTSNAPSRDPDWTYTDKRGHEHHYEGGLYPTLRWVVDETYWCDDCQEDHEDGHYECPECGEHIEPGMRDPSGKRELVSGLTSWYLDDEPISEEEAKRLIEDEVNGRTDGR